jgi:hypothetical protein
MSKELLCYLFYQFLLQWLWLFLVSTIVLGSYLCRKGRRKEEGGNHEKIVCVGSFCVSRVGLGSWITAEVLIEFEVNL